MRGDWSPRLVTRTRSPDFAGFISGTAWAAIFRGLKTDQELCSLWFWSLWGQVVTTLWASALLNYRCE